MAPAGFRLQEWSAATGLPERHPARARRHQAGPRDIPGQEVPPHRPGRGGSGMPPALRVLRHTVVFQQHSDQAAGGRHHRRDTADGQAVHLLRGRQLHVAHRPGQGPDASAGAPEDQVGEPGEHSRGPRRGISATRQGKWMSGPAGWAGIPEPRHAQAHEQDLQPYEGRLRRSLCQSSEIRDQALHHLHDGLRRRGDRHL